MTDLFPEAKSNVYIKKCECLVKGVSVIMARSLDPRYNVGQCPKCGKVLTDKIDTSGQG